MNISLQRVVVALVLGLSSAASAAPRPPSQPSSPLTLEKVREAAASVPSLAEIARLEARLEQARRLAKTRQQPATRTNPWAPAFSAINSAIGSRAEANLAAEIEEAHAERNRVLFQMLYRAETEQMVRAIATYFQVPMKKVKWRLDTLEQKDRTSPGPRQPVPTVASSRDSSIVPRFTPRSTTMFSGVSSFAAPISEKPRANYPTLGSLPQRTQEILALVAVQAEISRELEASLKAGLEKRDRESSALDSPFARSRDEDVLNELEAWISLFQTQNAPEEDLGVLLDFLRLKSDQMDIWFYALMDDFSKNHNQPWGQDSTDWIFLRMQLEADISAYGWDLMLWALVSEMATDPTERMALWRETVAFAEANTQQ